MRDVLVAAIIYTLLFVVLTTPVTGGIGNLSFETVSDLHHLFSELIFWGATLYICASSTYGAFVRQDRFGLSRNHPLLNRFLSILLLVSPFLAVFFNVRFVFLMLGLLLFSHVRSKTEEERDIEFKQSRALSNGLLLILFTVALMLMNNNEYYVSSLLDFSSTNSAIEVSDAR
jgi:accessory gene regulator protein AgrB